MFKESVSIKIPPHQNFMLYGIQFQAQIFMFNIPWNVVIKASHTPSVYQHSCLLLLYVDVFGVHIFVWVHLCVYMCVYCTSVCTCTCVRVWLHVYIFMHVHLYVCVCVWYTCVYVHACVCVRAHMCVVQILVKLLIKTALMLLI